MAPILLNKLKYVQLVKKSIVLIWNRNPLGVRLFNIITATLNIARRPPSSET